VTIEVWVRAKAPSRHVSCESSTTLWLFKQWTAILQTIDCRKAWGKQPTGTEQDSPHCLVWNSHKSQARIQQPICRTNHVAQQFSCCSLDNGTEKWRKVVLDNLWSHTSIGIHWHPFAVLEADDYRQKTTVCDLEINWYLWIIYTCIKKNLNNFIQIE
jgi:hypothetical protein